MDKRSLRRTIGAAGVIFYILDGFLTYGWAYNRTDPICYTRMPSGMEVCKSYRVLNGVVAGTFWPIYWAGHFAVEVTRP